MNQKLVARGFCLLGVTVERPFAGAGSLDLALATSHRWMRPDTDSRRLVIYRNRDMIGSCKTWTIQQVKCNLRNGSTQSIDSEQLFDRVSIR